MPEIYRDGAIHAPVSTWPKFCPACYTEPARRSDAKTDSGKPARRLSCAKCNWTERYVVADYDHQTPPEVPPCEQP